MRVLISLVVSSIVSLVSFLLIRSALRPRGSSLGPLSDAEQVFAVGLSLVIFIIVLYRMLCRTWNREQVDQLLDFDDTNL